MLVEVRLEGELVGVGVEEAVVFLTEDWVAHFLPVLQIQWNDLHMNRLASITKTEKRLIVYRVYLL